MGADKKVPERSPQIESLAGELNDAVARAHALVVGANAIGGMAKLSPLGADHLRRLVLEPEAAVSDAHELTRTLETELRSRRSE